MGPDYGTISHNPFQVRLLQCFEHPLPHPFLRPTIEANINAIPSPKAFRQISPGSTTTGNPKHCMNKQAVISRSAWISFFTWQ